jgi:hypothetical protein
MPWRSRNWTGAQEVSRLIESLKGMQCDLQVLRDLKTRVRRRVRR